MSDHHVRPPPRDQRDPQTRSLRSRSSSRDMSWRKPVPKFIPSPPISPEHTQSPQYTGSPTAAAFEYMLGREDPFSMSLTSLKNDLPPLPSDWKENINRVIRNESTTNLRSLKTPPISPVITSPTHGFMHGRHQNSAIPRTSETDRDRATFQEVDLGERRSRSLRRSADKENIPPPPPPSSDHGLRRLGISAGANESNVSVTRIPKTYRPPTPPLPSRKRPSAPSTPVTATMNKPMHILYPDLAGLGVENHTQRARSPESDDTTDTHTLQTARSSLTAWTNTLGTSADTSSLGDDDDQTLPVNQPSSSIRKSAVPKTMLVIEPHDPEPGFRKALGLWFDSFLNPFKSCMAGY